MRPAPPPTGRYTAHGRVVRDLDARAGDRLAHRRDHAYGQSCSGAQVQGDVTAVVHVRMLDSRPRREHRHCRVGHCAGHRRHRSDESARAGPHRGGHAARDRSARRRELRGLAAAQARQFVDQRAEPARKDAGQRLVRALDRRCGAAGAHDQIDWSVLQEEPVAIQPRCRRAVRKRSHVRAGPHCRAGGVAGEEVRGAAIV